MVASLLHGWGLMVGPEHTEYICPDVPRTSPAAGAGFTARAFSELAVSPVGFGSGCRFEYPNRPSDRPSDNSITRQPAGLGTEKAPNVPNRGGPAPTGW